MKEQEVYIKVSVDEELPNTDGWCETNEGTIRFSKGKFEIDEFWEEKVTWWLKPITAIVLTPEEIFDFSDYMHKNFYKVFLEDNYYQRSGGTVLNGEKFTRQDIMKIYLQSKEDKPTR